MLVCSSMSASILFMHKKNAMHMSNTRYENNGLLYDFLVITNPTSDLLNNAISAKSNDSFLLVKCRMSIKNWEQSPLRFGLSSLDEYEERIKFFSFSFGNYISLLQDNLLCSQLAFNYDANLNAAPFENFTLVFKLNKKFSKTKHGLFIHLSEPFLLKGTADIQVIHKKNNFFKKIIEL